MTAGLDSVGVAGNPLSPIHRLDPRTKVLGFGAITALAVSTTAWPTAAACAVVLTLLAGVARISPAVLARRARIVALPVLLVALFTPSAGVKAVIGVSSAVLLGATTSFPDVLHALERLRVPRVLILIASFMYRYLFVIVAEVGRMRSALAARGYAPRHALQAAALGRVATALFLRTYERGERVHLAMLARGFEQRMPRLHGLRFGRADALFACALAPLLAVRLFTATGSITWISAYLFVMALISLTTIYSLRETRGDVLAEIGPDGSPNRRPFPLPGRQKGPTVYTYRAAGSYVRRAHRAQVGGRHTLSW